MSFIDTQIISNSYKNNQSIKNCEISSIAISEFLDMYIPEDYTNEKFYPLSNSYIFSSLQFHIDELFKDKKHAKFSKRRTDKIKLEFNNSYPTIIEYGSMALHYAFKNKNRMLLLNSIACLDKKEQKFVSKKIEYLLDNDISCIPLNNSIINTALNLLLIIEDEKEINLKDNFRNSINDLLISSTAYDKGQKLITEDILLNRIIAKKLKIKWEKNNDILILKNTTEQKQKLFLSSESKGYINHGWKYSIYKK